MTDYIITNYERHRKYQESQRLGYNTSRKKKHKLSPKQRKAKKLLKKANRVPKAFKPLVAPRHYYLYGLLLENGNYYVGMTSYKNAIVRYQQHMDGKGARWTRLHKPIEMLEVRDIGTCLKKIAEDKENAMTLEYMERFGTACVRGGSLCIVSHAGHMRAYNKFSPVKIVVPSRYISADIKRIMSEEF